MLAIDPMLLAVLYLRTEGFKSQDNNQKLTLLHIFERFSKMNKKSYTIQDNDGLY